MNKELCIRCSKPTPYDINTPITLRRYFVEGSGQLCPLCYQELYGVAGALGVPFGTVTRLFTCEKPARRLRDAIYGRADQPHIPYTVVAVAWALRSTIAVRKSEFELAVESLQLIAKIILRSLPEDVGMQIQPHVLQHARKRLENWMQF